MSKTVELRKIVLSQIKKTGVEVYHQKATNKAKFPYITYSLRDTIRNYDRDDINLVIDVWGKGNSSELVEDLADTVEELLNKKNLPVGENFPTFYFELRNVVDDEDELIQRRQLRFTIQNYNIKK